MQNECDNLTQWKKFKRLYFTVRNPVVVYCGHKIDPQREPKNNCESCWFAFFNNNAEVVKTADELFREHGPSAIEQVRGKKFMRNFLRFMGTLAKWQTEAQAGNRYIP